MLDHARRLERELSGSHTRESSLSAEIEDLTVQRDALEAERDELKRLLSTHQETFDADKKGLLESIDRLDRELQNLNGQLEFPPGHFYSPIVDPEDPRVAEATLAGLVDPADGFRQISWSEEAMTGLARRMGEHYRTFPFPDHKSDGYRYYYDNPSFTAADAITLYGMIREVRPKRIIEVGAGFSSSLMMDTNDRIFGGGIELTFIDPYPDALLELLDEKDRYRGRIRTEALQDAPAELFRALDENDILFLDSSHVSKTGSDVNDYLFRILPSLNPGVVIHLHDIFYPFEYPSQWIQERRRSWNEAYVLRSFLMYNTAFELVFFNNYFYRKHREITREILPRCLENEGGSIWLRKVK